MKHALKALGCCKKQDPCNIKIANSATVVDGKLILSFPEAQIPVIWQMDLVNAKSSALEVQEKKDKKFFALILKTTKGETVEIAAFENRKNAIAALMAASYALQNAHGQIKQPQAGGAIPVIASGQAQISQTKNTRKKGKWIAVIITLALIIFLINLINSISPRPSSLIASGGNTVSGNTQSNDTSGVPVSADAYLKGQ